MKKRSGIVRRESKGKTREEEEEEEEEKEEQEKEWKRSVVEAVKHICYHEYLLSILM